MYTNPKEIKISTVIHATLGIVELIHKLTENDAIAYSHGKGEYFTIDVRDTDL